MHRLLCLLTLPLAASITLAQDPVPPTAEQAAAAAAENAPANTPPGRNRPTGLPSSVPGARTTTPGANTPRTIPGAVPAQGATTPGTGAPGAVPTPGATPPGAVTPGATPPGAVTPGAAPGTGAATPGAGADPVARPAMIPHGDDARRLITEPVDVIPCSGTDLAIAYRKYTGKRVIVASAAAGKEFSLFLDASPDDPLTYEMAAELLQRAAGIEGFVFVDDPNIKNLAYLTADARVTTMPYPVYNEGDELPDTDKVVTYVMTFRNIKPETAQQVFQQIIGQHGNYGSVAITNTQVIITEHTSLIRGLIKLKEEIDIPGDVPRTRFINVKYADVTELAGVLNELLSAQQQAQTSAATRRVQGGQQQAPGAPPGGGRFQQQQQQQGGAAANEETPIQIVPEPRTNRIFSMGRAVDLVFVEGLIREFDVETSEKTFLRRKLSFLAVAEFLPIAEDALTRAFGAGDGSPSSSSGGGSSRSTTTGTTQRQSSTTSNQGNFGQGMTQFGSGSTRGGMTTRGGGTSLNDPTISTAPESLLVGRTLLVADNITNSIVVQGPPSGLEIVERLLDQLDVKADQVMISTVIGQLALSKNLDYGMDYLVTSGDVISRLGGGIGSLVTPTTGTGADTTLGTGVSGFSRSDSVGGGGMRLYGTAGDLHILLKALATNNDFTVLARPSIFTANNQKGVISSGEQIAIPTNSNTYYQGGGNTQIQYVPVELRLEVIPLINSNDELTLQISLLSDEVSGNQTVAGAGPNGGDLTVPRVTTREVVTTVTVPNNETIVLGGLITTRSGEGVSGVPLLSDIPILGKLFSYTEKTNERAELLVFIQPSIVSSRGSLDANQRDADLRYRMAPEARDFANIGNPAPQPEAAPAAKAGKAGKSSAQVKEPVNSGSAKPAGQRSKGSIRPIQVR